MSSSSRSSRQQNTSTTAVGLWYSWRAGRGCWGGRCGRGVRTWTRCAAQERYEEILSWMCGAETAVEWHHRAGATSLQLAEHLRAIAYIVLFSCFLVIGVSLLDLVRVDRSQ